jgi:hypothetical protein
MTDPTRTAGRFFQGVRCALVLVIAAGTTSACRETVTYGPADAEVQAVGPAVADGDSLLISVTIYDIDGGDSALSVMRRDGASLTALPAGEVLASSLGPYGLRRREPETVWVRWTPVDAPSGAEYELVIAVAESDDPGLSLVVEW